MPMKKTILISVFVLLSGAIMAQGISFGPQIGYTTTSLSSDKSEIKTDLKSNFLFGAFLRVGGKWYLQPEINYFTSGSVFKSPNLNPLDGFDPLPIEDEITMKNIQVPLYIGYTLADLKLAKIRAMAGPTATFVVGKEVSHVETTELINDADINDLHWGLQFGAGVDVLMFTLDVQYNIGLSKVIEDVNVGNNQIKLDSRPSVFMVTLGWKIF